MRGRLRFTLILAAFALTAGACTSDGGTGDKAGGPGEPVVLKMGTTSGTLEFTPQIQYLVDRVEQLSDGNVRIEPVFEVGDFAPDSDQQLVRGVAAGDFDLGFTGTFTYEALGAENFLALSAPMLIDSYALEGAVIRSDITDQMLQGLEDVGVTGLGVLAGALRKPVTVDRPLLGPADWQGITFGIANAEGQAEAVRALGATPMKVVGDSRDRALEKGTIDGFESSLLAYRINGQEGTVPYVAANVNLWPVALAVVGNPDAIEGLSDQQRGWLQQATDEAAERSTALIDTDASTLQESCDAGARFALASDADLAALSDAFAPVYATLQQDPATLGFIEQIQELKASTPLEPSPAFGPECMGEAPGEAESAAGDAGAAASGLNGVYRVTITKQDAIAGGFGDDPDYPTTQTLWLEDGSWRIRGNEGGTSGTYVVNGDEITFDWPVYDSANSFTFAQDDEGNLTFGVLPPISPGDEEGFTTNPWIKIG